MDYMGNTDYSNNNYYQQKYNGMIEHFDSGIKEDFTTQVDAAANTLWLSKSAGSTTFNEGGNANQTRTLPNGQNTTLLAHVTGMSDEIFNSAFNTLVNNKNTLVSSHLFGDENTSNQLSSTNNSSEHGLYALRKYREIQRNAPSSNYKIEANVLSDVINKLIEDQDLVWQAEFSNDPDFRQKLQQFLIEQASLQQGNKIQSPFRDSIKEYNQSTNFYDNNLRLQSRNDFIKNFQDHSLNGNISKQDMLRSDIETKERYIQINRYEYYRKRDTVSYCKLIIVIAGLAAICYGIGLKLEDKRKIFNISSIVIYILGAIILWLKIRRDQVRYKLDWDEINFPGKDWNDNSKTDNCVSRTLTKMGNSISRNVNDAARKTGQVVAT